MNYVRNKQKIYQIFVEYGPLTPYANLAHLREKIYLSPTLFFRLFHALRTEGAIIPIVRASWEPQTPLDKAEWGFEQIRTNLYWANGEDPQETKATAETTEILP